MPTWLQCVDCSSKFYTATGEEFITNFTCQKCNGTLFIQPTLHNLKETRNILKSAPLFREDTKVWS